MPRPHLIYFADPMCSWCWGFSPVIDSVRERFGPSLPIRLVLGGLRPGTTEPLTDARKGEIREHWGHVHEASGQTFDWRFFDRGDFVYDTEPVSRAVAVIRQKGMEEALNFLKRAHVAFYAQNRDVTNEQALADLAVEAGHTRAEFLEAFRSEEARQETEADFAVTQQAGVRGFPFLIAGTDEQAGYSIVTHGFQPASRILPALERWLEMVSPSDAVAPGQPAA